MCRYGARRFKDGPARFLRPRSPRRRSRRPASARHTRSRVVWAFRGEGQARRCTPHAGRHRDAHPAPAGVVCAGRRTCIAEKRRCEWRFLATVARRARRTATHTTISVRKTTYVRHSRPEASANSASSAPRQRQIELRAASSLGQPRPASANLACMFRLPGSASLAFHKGAPPPAPGLCRPCKHRSRRGRARRH